MSKVSTFLSSLDLSADEIAVKARIPSERVRAILQGGDVSLADLRALARGLRVPLRNFAGDPAANSDLAMLFRSTAASRPDFGVEHAASFVQAALSILPPRTAPPEWLSKFEVGNETYEEAARLAESFRVLFTPDRLDDPLPELPEIIIDQGEVILGQLETSKFEGASVVADGYAFIFVSPRFSGRMLFTLAHEIGHLLAHHRKQRAVIFDRATQISGSRHRTASEAFANAFASVVLMPTRGVAIALREIRSILKIAGETVGDVELLYLARLYGVSFEVAARRCEDLELLPTGGARSLVDYLREHHGGAEKRANELGLPERLRVSIPRVSSNLLRPAAERIKSGTISLGWVTDRLGCTVNDIYAANASLEVGRGPHP
jgi:Zn-dependent peptidase ImmA (M78 family)